MCKPDLAGVGFYLLALSSLMEVVCIVQEQAAKLQSSSGLEYGTGALAGSEQPA